MLRRDIEVRFLGTAMEAPWRVNCWSYLAKNRATGNHLVRIVGASAAIRSGSLHDAPIPFPRDPH
jgi:hypothetical protein